MKDDNGWNDTLLRSRYNVLIVSPFVTQVKPQLFMFCVQNLFCSLSNLHAFICGKIPNQGIGWFVGALSC